MGCVHGSPAGLGGLDEDERQPIVFDETWRKAAWLPSGLLHTVAAPQLAAGHESRLGEWWILELDHFPDTGLRRAELVKTLTDAEHGLPDPAGPPRSVAR
ncbi:hypothetical protein [Streptomyces sp. EN23]|uniref:hypothetical protein n=1 Tax=Streptomyces sp. EN23 TaxID=212774 RepID=UPI00159F1D4D|nr:hypothetical protein [Streptomyces sp. EN23]